MYSRFVYTCHLSIAVGTVSIVLIGVSVLSIKEVPLHLT